MREKGRGMTGTYENGIYREGDVRLSDLSGRRRLPIGRDGFAAAVQESVIIDKSLLIADVLDSSAAVTLFCRPRRFGKSLNMTMLKAFFEIPPASDPNAEDAAYLFEGLSIWDAGGGRYREYQGAYPVIYISFNSVKKQRWEDAKSALRQLIVWEYIRHGYLSDSSELNEQERAYFDRVAGWKATDGDIESSLINLTRLLFKHHGRRTVVLIDEYDAPVMAARDNGYYDEMVSFLKGWLTAALKDGGQALAFACLTGVQRISKESVFSDLNNLVVNTSLNTKYDERYGFTEDEVRALANYLGQAAHFPEMRQWYDGYRFGSVDVYNPWSVLNYFDNDCECAPYWGNTSSNAPIAAMVRGGDARLMRKVYGLLETGGSVEAALDLSVVFGDLDAKPEALWSLLYLAGYLTTDDTEQPNSKDVVRRLRIPNLEIASLYRSEIIDRFAQIAGGRDCLIDLHRALVDGDADAFAEELEGVLLNSASFYDLASENSYHMLLVGLLFGVPGYGNPVSNREAGRGRFDIRLVPERAGLPTVTLELKFERGADTGRLEALAAEALAQIEARAYDAGATESGAGSLRYGIAFSGKSLAVAADRRPS